MTLFIPEFDLKMDFFVVSTRDHSDHHDIGIPISVVQIYDVKTIQYSVYAVQSIQSYKQTESDYYYIKIYRQTDGQTDRQTDRQTESSQIYR